MMCYVIYIVNGSEFDTMEVVFMADMVSSGATACATISIVDDMALEGPHSFSVSIVGSDPPLMTNDVPIDVTIEDNDGEDYLAVFRVVWLFSHSTVLVQVTLSCRG